MAINKIKYNVSKDVFKKNMEDTKRTVANLMKVKSPTISGVTNKYKTEWNKFLTEYNTTKDSDDIGELRILCAKLHSFGSKVGKAVSKVNGDHPAVKALYTFSNDETIEWRGEEVNQNLENQEGGNIAEPESQEDQIKGLIDTLAKYQYATREKIDSSDFYQNIISELTAKLDKMIPSSEDRVEDENDIIGKYSPVFESIMEGLKETPVEAEEDYISMAEPLVSIASSIVGDYNEVDPVMIEKYSMEKYGENIDEIEEFFFSEIFWNNFYSDIDNYGVLVDFSLPFVKEDYVQRQHFTDGSQYDFHKWMKEMYVAFHELNYYEETDNIDKKGFKNAVMRCRALLHRFFRMKLPKKIEYLKEKYMPDFQEFEKDVAVLKSWEYDDIKDMKNKVANIVTGIITDAGSVKRQDFSAIEGASQVASNVVGKGGNLVAEGIKNVGQGAGEAIKHSAPILQSIGGGIKNIAGAGLNAAGSVLKGVGSVASQLGPLGTIAALGGTALGALGLKKLHDKIKYKMFSDEDFLYALYSDLPVEAFNFEECINFANMAKEKELYEIYRKIKETDNRPSAKKLASIFGYHDEKRVEAFEEAYKEYKDNKEKVEEVLNNPGKFRGEEKAAAKIIKIKELYKKNKGEKYIENFSIPPYTVIMMTSMSIGLISTLSRIVASTSAKIKAGGLNKDSLRDTIEKMKDTTDKIFANKEVRTALPELKMEYDTFIRTDYKEKLDSLFIQDLKLLFSKFTYFSKETMKAVKRIQKGQNFSIDPYNDLEKGLNAINFSINNSIGSGIQSAINSLALFKVNNKPDINGYKRGLMTLKRALDKFFTADLPENLQGYADKLEAQYENIIRVEYNAKVGKHTLKDLKKLHTDMERIGDLALEILKQNQVNFSDEKKDEDDDIETLKKSIKSIKRVADYFFYEQKMENPNIAAVVTQYRQKYEKYENKIKKALDEENKQLLKEIISEMAKIVNDLKQDSIKYREVKSFVAFSDILDERGIIYNFSELEARNDLLNTVRLIFKEIPSEKEAPELNRGFKQLQQRYFNEPLGTYDAKVIGNKIHGKNEQELNHINETMRAFLREVRQNEKKTGVTNYNPTEKPHIKTYGNKRYENTSNDWNKLERFFISMGKSLKIALPVIGTGLGLIVSIKKIEGAIKP